ncbi:uncharacterized protein NFIA_047560 [Aspergillus fischeri NRRL 181]|uniref:Uncharacterized protein n=1 Tax=Neosartorya fischeri (strain ATCC 1020 / DSM 3700 / CBS 544.65 / FGSC A1164 / JCM 1740 / NRRL 181 / WB 181) TaxID=331117 RepID=A1DKV0_NEOFI|nr:uncharacterized protein NFIA_047560 [Aspergillus fischeri NRRL 181]EAW15421.1 hypothetical protein NFIA_047560 [Aspergillus fischeri NRRL 181]KAG2016899.1 hypothetical protein GB937_006102 [Aspergillus fischeri]
MHRTISTLEIKLVKSGDISAITELWYNAFNIPQNLKMFPDTPGVRQWWNEAHRKDILHNPHRSKVDRNFPPGMRNPIIRLAIRSSGCLTKSETSSSEKSSSIVGSRTFDKEEQQLGAHPHKQEPLLRQPNHSPIGSA